MQGIYTLQLLLGPLWKQRRLPYYNTVAVGPFCKQGILYITVAIGCPFESV